MAAAVGGGQDATDRARRLIDAGVDVLVVDSAHGHSEGVLRTVSQLRESFPDTQLIAGNIATEAGAREMVRRGVDAVKVGTAVDAAPDSGELSETPPAAGDEAQRSWAVRWAVRRKEAKAARDYAEADRVRGLLKEAGWEVRDNRDGSIEVVRARG